MPDSTWVSTTGDLNAAASYTPSGVPIAAGTLYFNDSSQMDVISNLTALASVDITRIWFQESYYGNVGADGNPLTVGILRFIHNGAGRVYHAHSAFGSVTSYVVVNSPNQQDAYTLTSTDGAGGVTYTLAVLSGGVNILSNSTSVIGKLIVGGGRVPGSPHVTIGDVNSIPLYRQIGGTVTTKKMPADAIVDGGTLIYDVAGTAGASSLELTGGRVEYSGTGTITRCIVANGTLDMTKDSRAKTITLLILLPGASFLTHDNITVTKVIDLRPKYPILGEALP